MRVNASLCSRCYVAARTSRVNTSARSKLPWLSVKSRLSQTHLQSVSHLQQRPRRPRGAIRLLSSSTRNLATSAENGVEDSADRPTLKDMVDIKPLYSSPRMAIGDPATKNVQYYRHAFKVLGKAFNREQLYHMYKELHIEEGIPIADGPAARSISKDEMVAHLVSKVWNIPKPDENFDPKTVGSNVSEKQELQITSAEAHALFSTRMRSGISLLQRRNLAFEIDEGQSMVVITGKRNKIKSFLRAFRKLREDVVSTAVPEPLRMTRGRDANESRISTFLLDKISERKNCYITREGGSAELKITFLKSQVDLASIVNELTALSMVEGDRRHIPLFIETKDSPKESWHETQLSLLPCSSPAKAPWHQPDITPDGVPFNRITEESNEPFHHHSSVNLLFGHSIAATGDSSDRLADYLSDINNHKKAEDDIFAEFSVALYNPESTHPYLSNFGDSFTATDMSKWMDESIHVRPSWVPTTLHGFLDGTNHLQPQLLQRVVYRKIESPAVTDTSSTICCEIQLSELDAAKNQSVTNRNARRDMTVTEGYQKSAGVHFPGRIHDVVVSRRSYSKIGWSKLKLFNKQSQFDPPTELHLPEGTYIRISNDIIRSMEIQPINTKRQKSVRVVEESRPFDDPEAKPTTKAQIHISSMSCLDSLFGEVREANKVAQQYHAQ